MQERFAAANATIKEYMVPVAISTSKSSQYSNSDESDGGTLSPKNTDATELKIDESLQNIFESLLHLEPLHYGFYGFKLQMPNQSASCMCLGKRWWLNSYSCSICLN
jgi:hypothetical protein